MLQKLCEWKDSFCFIYEEDFAKPFWSPCQSKDNKLGLYILFIKKKCINKILKNTARKFNDVKNVNFINV